MAVISCCALSILSTSAHAQNETTWRVSVDSLGAEGDGDSNSPSISSSGRYVAFDSQSTDLVSNDTNGTSDVFLRDRESLTTIRVSIDSSGVEGDADSSDPAISDNGRFVAFLSNSTNLVAGDTNGKVDVFVHDRLVGTTTRVSVDSSGVEGNDHSERPAISGDGRFVAFSSKASNLVPGDSNWVNDTFVHDIHTATTTRVSLDSAGTEANNTSGDSSLSGDGRFVAFNSDASNLVAGDTNWARDVFVHDRQTGTTTRVSVDSAGAEGDAQSESRSISRDGRFVALTSRASNLVPSDTNGSWDAFVHDLQTATTTRVSVDSSGAEGNGSSYTSSISADGNLVAFDSHATNLVAGDGNWTPDVFVHDRTTGDTTRVSLGDSGNEGNNQSSLPAIAGNGRFVVFESDANNLVAGDGNGSMDVFVRGDTFFLRTTSPVRSRYNSTTAVTLKGHGFTLGSNLEVRYGSWPATDVVVVDDTTVTCTTPIVDPGQGFIDVTVSTTAYSDTMSNSFVITPAVILEGDQRIGGEISARYLCDPFEGVFAILGLPPMQSIDTPPFDGKLCISPFWKLFLVFSWPFDEFKLSFDIPDDPGLIGMEVLFQALVGPEFGLSGPSKNAAWTNCTDLIIK